MEDRHSEKEEDARTCCHWRTSIMDANLAIAAFFDLEDRNAPVAAITDNDSSSESSDDMSSDNDGLSTSEEEDLDMELFGQIEYSSDEFSDDDDDADYAADEPAVIPRGRGRGRDIHSRRARGIARGGNVRGGIARRARGAQTRVRGARIRARGACRQGQPVQDAGIGYPPISGYNDEDMGGPGAPDFQPSSPAGLKLPPDFLPTCEADFFRLFFSVDVVERIVEFTNAYAVARIAERSSYSVNNEWTPTTVQEMYCFLALLLFQGFHKLPEIRDYWKTSSLHNGNYARAMIPAKRRFEALLCFLKVVDHHTEAVNDRLRKVRYLHDVIKQRCRELFKPSQAVAIDERMVKCKGRASFIQYCPAKPVKWGFKLFAACDTVTSILVNFEVYTGQGDVEGGGLAQNVVVRLAEDLMQQNYVIYTDNFYSSAMLADTLLNNGTYLVGTVRSNRRGYPRELKNTMKQFEKKAVRGAMRYVRDGPILYQQWKDKRCVSTISTVHAGHDHVQVQRKTKQNGQFQMVQVDQPQAIADYNRSMGGVDLFDQHIATYRILRRARKFWKSLFFDLVDLSTVNAYLMFELWMKANPGAIKRPRHHRHNDFRTRLIRQLAGIPDNAPPPIRTYRGKTAAHNGEESAAAMHLPKFLARKKNCRNCREVDGAQRQCVSICRNCNVPLHTNHRECFLKYHERHFPRHIV